MSVPDPIREGVLRRLTRLTPLVRGRMAEVVRHVKENDGTEVVFIGDAEAEFTLRVADPEQGIVASNEVAQLRLWGSFPGEEAMPESTGEEMHEVYLDWLADCWRGAGGFNLPLDSVRVIHAHDPQVGHELWGRG